MKVKKYQLRFEPKAVEVPITSRMISRYGLEVNILRAEITESGGMMVVSLQGPPASLHDGLQYLAENGVAVSELIPLVQRDEGRCTDCGVCVSMCPAKAYSIAPPSWKVEFCPDRCVSCGLCRDSCPSGAIRLSGA